MRYFADKFHLWGALIGQAASVYKCDAAIDRIYGIGVGLNPINCLNRTRSATFNSIKISLITKRLSLHNHALATRPTFRSRPCSLPAGRAACHGAKASRLKVRAWPVCRIANSSRYTNIERIVDDVDFRKFISNVTVLTFERKISKFLFLK